MIRKMAWTKDKIRRWYENFKTGPSIKVDQAD